MSIRRWLLLFYPRRSVGVPAAPVFSDTVAGFPVPDVSVTRALLLMLLLMHFLFNHAVSEVALSSLVLIFVLKSNPVFKI